MSKFSNGIAVSAHHAGGFGLSQGELLLSGGIMLDTPVVDGLSLVEEYCITSFSLQVFCTGQKSILSFHIKK